MNLIGRSVLHKDFFLLIFGQEIGEAVKIGD